MISSFGLAARPLLDDLSGFERVGDGDQEAARVGQVGGGDHFGRRGVAGMSRCRGPAIGPPARAGPR